MMKKLVYIFLLMLLFTACKKENNARDFKGVYKGTFRIIANQKTVSTDFEMTLIDKTFKVNNGTKLASGEFKVQDTKSITFTDKNFWTADFDWNLILNGTYVYEAKGDSLILTKGSTIASDVNPSIIYQYRLKRSN